MFNNSADQMRSQIQALQMQVDKLTLELAASKVKGTYTKSGKKYSSKHYHVSELDKLRKAYGVTGAHMKQHYGISKATYGRTYRKNAKPSIAALLAWALIEKGADVKQVTDAYILSVADPE